MRREGGLILLTGATGYVGGRLLRALEADGRPLRCMARRPEYLRSRVGAAPRWWRATCWIRTRSRRAFAAWIRRTT